MLGIDIVHLPRMARLLERYPRVVSRILSDAELTHLDAFATASSVRNYVGGRWAAKESLFKTLGQSKGQAGLLEWMPRCTILLNDGCLTIYVDRKPMKGIYLSISHDGDYAVAVSACLRGSISHKGNAHEINGELDV